MSYAEDELLPLSGLQHLAFCERQCALIHIEQVWAENLYTAEGRILHERVHDPDQLSKGNIRVEYGMPLRSLRLGVVGKADVVEFHRIDGTDSDMWRPFPVEYKRGRPKRANEDRIQLCAQAICLEEMLRVKIPTGALFYGKTRRREDVALDTPLRLETEETARRLHVLIEAGVTPKPVHGKQCEACSLKDLCLPKALERGKSVHRYLMNAMREE